MAMGRPRMTAEQRGMAVALLANAIRKEAHLRTRAEAAAEGGELAAVAGARGRREASGQYVRGMRDLLAVLFEGGAAVADECLAAARAAALGNREARLPEDRGGDASTG